MNNIATQLLLKLLVAYNRFCIQTKIRVKTIRKQNVAANSVCSFFEQIWSYIAMFFVYITRNKIEPSTTFWVCACKYLPEGNGLSAMTTDTYLEFYKSELDDIRHMRLSKYYIFYNKFLDAKIKLIEPAHRTANLIIASLSEKETLVQFAKKMNIDIGGAKYCAEGKSSARFLGIEYVCGNLPSIQIDIPKSHYMAGNEILSKAYVLRYLEHLPIYSNWIYIESDYILRLIDCDSNIFVMNSKQYILLEKDKYVVVFQSDANRLASDVAPNVLGKTDKGEDEEETKEFDKKVE
jgi:hypothetical protein